MTTQNEKPEILTPELRYSRVLFFLVLGLLLLVPLIWASKEPSVLAQFRLFESNAQQLLTPTKKPAPGVSTQASSIVPTRDYEAIKTTQSASSLSLKPGEKIRMWVEFQNIGKKTWLKEAQQGFIAMNTKDPEGRVSAFQAADWDKNYDRYYYRPNRMDQASVAPGQIARFYITLQAPNKIGSYMEHFGVVSEGNEWVTGGSFQLPITVSANTVPYLYQARRGKVVRVGIWNTENKVEISSSGAFKIKDAAGKLIAAYHREQVVTVSYTKGIYTLEGPTSTSPRGWTATSKNYITFEPAPYETMEIVNYESRPSWNKALNDNYFRGTLEYRHSPQTNKTWVINTLQLEAYVRGVGEVSNSTPKEMQKAMAIVERTYAEYHRRAYTKHAKDYFHVDNTYDQVYKGVGVEFRNPEVTRSVHETTGKIVTYNGLLAVTPYFSRSDGKTRSYTQVWGGSGLPWLVAVDVPWSKGKTLLGHGVGMDAYGGVQMAAHGSSAAAILSYFYTGTTLSNIY